MAKTNFVVTDANVGEMLPIADGYVTNLSMVTPPSDYDAHAELAIGEIDVNFALRLAAWTRARRH
jgi:hypothetical protein